MNCLDPETCNCHCQKNLIINIHHNHYVCNAVPAFSVELYWNIVLLLTYLYNCSFIRDHVYYSSIFNILIDFDMVFISDCYV